MVFITVGGVLGGWDAVEEDVEVVDPEAEAETEGNVYWVSERVPERTFIRQCASAWSCRGEPFPGLQTRIN